MLGYSLNNLSLFGLVLAIGIVVDDAIVVVENVERNIEDGMSPLEAARTSMDEVGAGADRDRAGAVRGVRADACSSAACRARSTSSSRSPSRPRRSSRWSCRSRSRPPHVGAAAARHRAPAADAPALAPTLTERAGDGFNRGFERLQRRYAPPDRAAGADAQADDGGLCRADRADRRPRCGTTPTGFIPLQDQGYFSAVIQLPPGSATARTDAVMKKIAARMLPIHGITNTVMLCRASTALPETCKRPPPAPSTSVLERFR